MSIHLIRPIIDMDTRLRDIPLDWLRYVEPKIMRGPYLPCWIWAAQLDPNGYPLLRDPHLKKVVMGHRWVARLFWSYPNEMYVTQTCPRRNCVNPGHLLVTAEHPRWMKPVEFGKFTDEEVNK
jgi:hypothetical protein